MDVKEKEIREKIAKEMSYTLKTTMENLCGLGRDGYSKVEDWHKSLLNMIKNGTKSK